MKEDDVSKDDALEIWNDEREGWLVYEAKPKK